MKITRKFKRKIERNTKNRAVKQAGKKLVTATLLGLALSTLPYGAVYAATTTGATDLILDSCLPAVPEQFEPQLVSLSLDIILQHLTEEYPALMRTIWAGEIAASLV